MEREKKHGLMELCMKAITYKERNMEWESSDGLMAQYTQDNS